MGSMNRTLILVNERRDPGYDPVQLNMDESLIEGVDITRPICRCKFAHNGANLGQGCSKPTSGGSGSAEFGTPDGGEAGDSNIGTIAVAGAIGVGVLLLLGVI